MDALLVIVTLVSLALAFAMGVVCWRVVAEERRRSAARIEALTDAPGEYKPDAHQSSQSGALDGPRRSAPAAPGSSSAVPSASPPPQSPSLADPSPPPVQGFSSAMPNELFASSQDRRDDGGRRLAILAVVAAVMVVGLGGTFLLHGSRSSSGPGTVAATAAAPLELLSLRHSRQGQELTIAGLVHNPQGGAPLVRGAAVAFLFDRDGAFLSSVRAPLDFTALRPGDDSPFVITLRGGSAPAVARYRISFRTEQGEVLPHIDRRVDPRQSVGGRKSSVVSQSAVAGPQSPVLGRGTDAPGAEL
jgi:hypothetical protein